MADEIVNNSDVEELSMKIGTMTANNLNQPTRRQHLDFNERNTTGNITSSVDYSSSECVNLKFDDDKCDMKLPAINLPEKILIAVDIVKENDCTPFELESGSKYMPVQMIKRAIEIFIRIKGNINDKHEYALMILNNDSADIICEFTNNDKTLSHALDKLREITINDRQNSYDLTSLFNIVSSLYKKILKIGEHPLFVNRVILIYMRSNVIPILTMREHFNMLMGNNYFFFDALFVHEPANNDNDSEKVYNRLCELDIKQNSWIFEVGRSAAQLHTSMAKLLAHPLQRPKQDSAEYKIFTNDSEIQTNV